MRFISSSFLAGAMRWIAFVVLLAIPLTGSALAPYAPQPPVEAPIEATSFAPALPAQTAEPSDPASCVPLLTAARQGDFVLLSWTECPGADRYQVFAGPSEAELDALVEVNHASHVDLPRGWATAVYAVRALGGPLSAPLALPLG